MKTESRKWSLAFIGLYALTALGHSMAVSNKSSSFRYVHVLEYIVILLIVESHYGIRINGRYSIIKICYITYS